MPGRQYHNSLARQMGQTMVCQTPLRLLSQARFTSALDVRQGGYMDVGPATVHDPLPAALARAASARILNPGPPAASWRRHTPAGTSIHGTAVSVHV